LTLACGRLSGQARSSASAAERAYRDTVRAVSHASDNHNDDGFTSLLLVLLLLPPRSQCSICRVLLHQLQPRITDRTEDRIHSRWVVRAIVGGVSPGPRLRRLDENPKVFRDRDSCLTFKSIIVSTWPSIACLGKCSTILRRFQAFCKITSSLLSLGELSPAIISQKRISDMMTRWSRHDDVMITCVVLMT
jgi:hypothetical protein